MTVILGEINWYRGDDFPLEITLTSGGNALDITGYSFKLTVDSEKYPIDTSTKIFEVAGVLNSDPTTGKCSFSPLEADTNIIVEKIKYYYDIQMIFK